MILVTKYKMFKDKNVISDVYNALKHNCRSRYIKEIIIFILGNTEINIRHDKVRMITVKETDIINNEFIKKYVTDKFIITTPEHCYNVGDFRKNIISKPNKIIETKKEIKPRIIEKKVITNNNKNIKDFEYKILVHVHLYYQDMLDYYFNLIKKLKDEHVKCVIDIVFTITEGVAKSYDDEIRIIDKLKTIGGEVYIMPNKGLDIGPFLQVLKIKYHNNYDLVFKLHTKKSILSSGSKYGDKWRDELINPIVKYNNIFKVFNDNKIGMIGSKKWKIRHTQNNDELIDKLRKKLKVKNTKGFFIGGTMFWCRWNIIKQNFTDQDLIDIYHDMKTGYFLDHKVPTITHSMERILGDIVYNSNYDIRGI